MDDFDLVDMIEFFKKDKKTKVIVMMMRMKKKRNGLSSGFVKGKRKHKFSKADLEKEIR